MRGPASHDIIALCPTKTQKSDESRPVSMRERGASAIPNGKCNTTKTAGSVTRLMRNTATLSPALYLSTYTPLTCVFTRRSREARSRAPRIAHSVGANHSSKPLTKTTLSAWPSVGFAALVIGSGMRLIPSLKRFRRASQCQIGERSLAKSSFLRSAQSMRLARHKLRSARSSRSRGIESRRLLALGLNPHPIHHDSTYDPLGNLLAAYRISNGGTDWSAWSCG